MDQPILDSFPAPLEAGSGRLDLLLSPDHLFILPPKEGVLIHPTPTGATPHPPTTIIPLSVGVVSAAVSGAHAHAPGIFVCTTDTQVLLLHWDGLLGEWERVVVSEGEGRIGSVVLEGQPGGRRLWVAAFKWDTILLYLLTSAHPLVEPGPLILESIQELGRLDKSKEPTTGAHAFLCNDSLLLLSLSYPLSLKMWEFSLDSGKGRLLKQVSGGLSLKNVVASDLLTTTGGDHYLLLLSSEGAAEVFHLLPGGFTLLNRFRVGMDDIEPMSEFQSEWRVLGGKFYSCQQFESQEERNNKGPLPFVRDKGMNPFPQLLLLTATTRGLSVVNAKSGHVLLLLPYHKILTSSCPHPLSSSQEMGVVVAMEAVVCLQDTKTVLAIHPLFSEVIHLLNLDLAPFLREAVAGNSSSCSLLTSEILQPKSVLRKRFKSPPHAQPSSHVAVPGGRRKSHSRRGTPLFRVGRPAPAWVTKVRSKNRPSSSSRKVGPDSARSQSPVSATYVPVPLPRGGNWEDTEGSLLLPSFGDRLRLESCLMGSHGHSYLRLAMAHDASVLAAGGSGSPVAIVRTRKCWESVRLFKDISRVTSLHFNFQGNLLLVGSNDGRTRIISWRRGKEVLSWEFHSKFNEHIHSQFYFMDKFVLQPELSSLALYALREDPPIGGVRMLRKLRAATFTMIGAQSITALAAPNRFLSSGILTGLSNKALELFDVNAETVVSSIPSAHSKPVTCIRINEAPVGGPQTTHLSNLILTSAPCHLDPVKLWDLRTTCPVLRLSDVNPSSFVGAARPALSPCGRFIATGLEDNSLVVYDTRRLQSRHSVYDGLGSTVLDCIFDPKSPTIWAGCRNGSFWKLL